jgi:[protein-PII] uridylyltransferase
MATIFDSLPNRRAIIDRRTLSDTIAALAEKNGRDPAVLRPLIVAELRQALEHGRKDAEARLAAHPTRGRETVSAFAFLIDQILRVLYDATASLLYPANNPSTGERIALIAVGGYGRGEMAPHSDIDIGFITPYKPTGWTEQVIESMLYSLWDLGLKVGHSSRSADETIRMARADLTVRTALLEARYIWGDRALYEQVAARFDSEVMRDTAQSFVAEKLAERDERHKRMGDSRYVVEPNVKEIGRASCRERVS